MTPRSTFPTISSESSTFQPTALVLRAALFLQRARVFRFPWGRHRGKLLSEVPRDYIRWLQNSSDAYKTDKRLQETVSSYLSSTTNNVPSSSSMPSSASQPLARSSSFQRTPSLTQVLPSSSVPMADGPYVLTFGKHAGKRIEEVPADYIAWLKKNEMYQKNEALRSAIEEWDKIPRVYHLCFGKYKGCTLDQVPPTYLNWLHDFGAEEGHDDLRQALKEHKKQNTALQVSSVQSSTSATTGRKKKPFELPSEYTSDYKRYYYNGDRKAGQMWIGCHDCVRYFGADPKAMTAAGLKPFHKDQRFWLHQVFAYAKHFGTTKHETPTKALNKFKAKNYNK